MWLSKSLYELLPLYYIAVGLAALFAGLYVNDWYWPIICVALGLASLIGGLAIWLKRRDYRASRSRLDFKETE